MALLFAALPLLQVTAVLARKYSVLHQITGMGKHTGLTKLVIPVSQFNHLESGDEIFWNHNEYDIVSVSRQGNYWEIAAINDCIEYHLLKSMATNSANDFAKNKMAIYKDWCNFIPFDFNLNSISQRFVYPRFYIFMTSGFAVPPHSPPECLG